MDKFLVWMKSIFATLNQFINGKLLILEKNDRINSLFETRAVDVETVNSIVILISDILVVLIFLWIIKKIVNFLYNKLRRKRNIKRNQQRQTQKNGSHRKKVYRRRNGGISNLLSRFKFVRRKKVRKTKSSSSGYIDGNGKLGYDEYEDDYSYDEPEDMYVQHRGHSHTRIKNSDGENTIYIPRGDFMNNAGNAVQPNQPYDYNQQAMYGNGNLSGQPIYGNRYSTTNEESAIYRGSAMKKPKAQEDEYVDDTLEFSQQEQDNDDGKTRVFKRKK